VVNSGSIFDTLPGDEGFNISHAGGEHEVFEGLVHEIGSLNERYRHPFATTSV